MNKESQAEALATAFHLLLAVEAETFFQFAKAVTGKQSRDVTKWTDDDWEAIHTAGGAVLAAQTQNKEAKENNDPDAGDFDVRRYAKRIGEQVRRQKKRKSNGRKQS